MIAPLIAYNYELHDGLVLQMYGKMRESGDLQRVFDRSLWVLTDFLHFFKMECALVFLDDSEGIWFAAWIRQSRASVAELSVWIRGDKRGRFNKEALLAMETVCGRTLALYSTILGLSRPDLVSIHKGLGYCHVGQLCEGVEMFTLTEDNFKPRLYREK